MRIPQFQDATPHARKMLQDGTVLRSIFSVRPTEMLLKGVPSRESCWLSIAGAIPNHVRAESSSSLLLHHPKTLREDQGPVTAAVAWSPAVLATARARLTLAES